MAGGGRWRGRDRDRDRDRDRQRGGRDAPGSLYEKLVSEKECGSQIARPAHPQQLFEPPAPAEPAAPSFEAKLINTAHALAFNSLVSNNENTAGPRRSTPRLVPAVASRSAAGTRRTPGMKGMCVCAWAVTQCAPNVRIPPAARPPAVCDPMPACLPCNGRPTASDSNAKQQNSSGPLNGGWQGAPHTCF